MSGRTAERFYGLRAGADNHLPRPHHHDYVIETADIDEWIATNRDQVGFLAGLDSPNYCPQSNGIRGNTRGGRITFMGSIPARTRSSRPMA